MIKTVTVIGDGQLARMMQPAAIELGIKLHLLAGTADSSAAQVIPSVTMGDYTCARDCLTAAAGSDAVTFDHEHVPVDALAALLDAGHCVQPQPSALIHAQDKLIQRRRLSELGAPVPEFAGIDSLADARAFWDRVDGHVCLKACRGGYDGKGVWFPDTREEFESLARDLLAAGTPLMAERKVRLTRELSILVARRPSGEAKAWPITMSIQEKGVCAEAIAPAPRLDSELAARATQLGLDIAANLDVTGVLAVELFAFIGGDGCLDGDGGQGGNVREDIAVNELAMRPHNTGHWTQDGAVTSQFEQHLRAVLDLPLGSTDATAPVTVMANVLGAESDPDMPMSQRVSEVARRFPSAKIHLYGKEHRPGRKIGHVNLSGTDLETTRRDARLAAGFLVHATWADHN